MAAVTSQASIAGLRPCASKTRFLAGSSGKLNREVSFKPVATTSFKVEAKKGQWLPGLASPGYLDGRYLHGKISIFQYILIILDALDLLAHKFFF